MRCNLLRVPGLMGCVLAAALLIFSASAAQATNRLTNGSFESGTTLPSSWTLDGGTGNWAVDTTLYTEGTRSLRLDLPAANTADGSTAGRSGGIGGLGGTAVRLSGKIRSEGITQSNSRYAAVIQLVSTHFTETIAEYHPNSQEFTYFEREVQIPSGVASVRVDVRGYGANGSVWFDDLVLEPLSEVTPTSASAFWWPQNMADPWLSPENKYRIGLTLDDVQPGDPVLLNLDPQRLLLEDAERNPFDIGSVKVFAKFASSQTTPVTAVFDSPLSQLAFHYPMDGFLRFRAVEDAVSYSVYFSAAGSGGVQPPVSNPHLGIGERLRYDDTTENWLWGGWVGGVPVVVDADGDSDLDIYLSAFDGMRFIARNVGSNAAPVFLPRSRPLPSDVQPFPPLSPWRIDWDQDGDLDQVTILRQPLGAGEYADGANARYRVQFNTSGSLGTAQEIQDLSGNPVELAGLASWSEVIVADVDQDGKDDLLIGSAGASLLVLLNRGVASGKPQVEVACLRVAEDVAPGCLSEDMALMGTPVDWDNDGDLDLIVTGWQGFVFYLENKGIANTLEFEPAVKLMQQGGAVSGVDSAAPCAVDWDDDGDLDLLIGGVTGHILYVENVGTVNNPVFAQGVFLKDSRNLLIQVEPSAEGGTIQGPFESYWGYLSVEAFDWDEDGDIDLVINDSLGRLSWIENTGTRSVPQLAYPYHRLHTKVDLASNLVAHWKFDGNLVDSSGNGYTLTSIGSGGAPGYAPGLQGSAVSLNNSTATQALASTAISFGSTDAISFSAWVYPTTLGAGFTTTSPHTVGVFYHSANSNRMEVRIRDSKPDVFQTNPSANYIGQASLTVNNWHHIVAVQNRNSVKIYLDGELTEHFFPSDGLDFNRLILGSASAASLRGLNGLLDEVRVYRRELLDNEVKALYAENELAGDLVAHWAFENDFTDASGNGNTLSSIGSGGAPSFTASGLKGNAAVFDNSSAPQVLARPLSFGAAEPITLTAWFYPTTLGSGFTTYAPHSIGVFYNSTNSNQMNVRIRDSKPDVYHTYPAANHQGTATLALNAWNHVAVVAQGTSIRVYHNGVLCGSFTTSGGLDFDRFVLGSAGGTSTRGLNGRLDEVRLYRRALTADEIATLHEAELAGVSAATHLPIVTPWRNRPGVGDFDSDGLGDLVLLDRSGRLGWYERDATDPNLLDFKRFMPAAGGKFMVASVYKRNAMGRTQIDLADWDDDGDLDLMIGQDWVMHSKLSSLFFFENTGNNTNPVYTRDHLVSRDIRFIEWTGHNGIHNGHSAHPEMVDWDGDGTMDLLVGTESGRVIYYAHDYFEGETFPTWESIFFEKQDEETMVYRKYNRARTAIEASKYLLYE